MNQSNSRDQQLDGLLDSALAQYGAVEPLHGMEERVLGRLREEPARRAWWMWGGAAAAVLAAVVVAVLLARPAEQKPVRRGTAGRQPEVVSPVPPPAPTQAVHQSTAPKTEVVVAQHAGGTRKQSGTSVASDDLPRRAVFPTPTPPNEQERLLARYMRVTPREEVLAQINRKPLDFHEDPLDPAGGDATSPHKAEGTK